MEHLVQSGLTKKISANTEHKSFHTKEGLILEKQFGIWQYELKVTVMSSINNLYLIEWGFVPLVYWETGIHMENSDQESR